MIDQKDWQIIELLQRNGRATYGELADVVGLSQSSIHDRLRKLEARGLIRGYGARVNREALGLRTTAFVGIATSIPGKELTHLLEPFLEIEELYSVDGEDAAILKVCTRDVETLQDFLDELRSLPELEKVHTTVALQTLLQRDLVTRERATKPGSSSRDPGSRALPT